MWCGCEWGCGCGCGCGRGRGRGRGRLVVVVGLVVVVVVVVAVAIAVAVAVSVRICLMCESACPCVVCGFTCPRECECMWCVYVHVSLGQKERAWRTRHSAHTAQCTRPPRDVNLRQLRACGG